MTRVGIGEVGDSAQEAGRWNLGQLLGLASQLGGWVTTDLAARWVWPKHPEQADESRRKKTEALIRRAVAADLLLPRPLGGRRRAYALTRTGATWLGEGMFELPSGTGWGRMDQGKWSPPATLQHDERAARFLIWLAAGHGYLVRTGHELAKANPKVSKLPDGLVSKTGAVWYWLEVENARKSGQAMRHMAQELIAVEQGRGPWLAVSEDTTQRVQPRRAMLLLPNEQHRDERGYRLSHKSRIEQAVRRESPISPIKLRFFVETHPWEWQRAETTI